MRHLTPQLFPILKSVMGEPEEQLVDSTREELQQLVAYLGKMAGK